jgi:N-acetylmuramic acid 6-phosphate etherase
MIRLGKTFGNLMVDVDATNDKLRARLRRVVRQATGASSDEVESVLAECDGQAKVAIVALLTGADAETAERLLADADGVVRRALAP